MKTISLVLALVAMFATAAPAQTARKAEAAPDCGTLPAAWAGQAYAIDGDTLAGVELKPHIRLFGVQAPELRDGAKGERVAGMRARAALEDLLEPADHKVRCQVSKFDRYCRIVAQCAIDDGTADAADGRKDLAGALLAAGLAYGFYLDEVLAWEPRASQRYASAEAEARKQRRGLWKEWLGEK